MTHRRFAKISAALALAWMVIASPAAAQTCLCTEKAFDTRYKEAPVIFIGTVRSIEVVEAMRQPGWRDQPAIVQFAVDDGIKGVATGGTFTLHDSLTVNTCTGHPFEPSERYMVYAYARVAEKVEDWSIYDFPTGTYGTGGLCGGTKKAGDPRVPGDMERIVALQAAEAAEAEKAAKKKSFFGK